MLRGAVCEAGQTHARPTAPGHGYSAAAAGRKTTQRAAPPQARKIVRQACHILTEPGGDALTVT